MSSPGFEVCLKVDTKARAVLLALHVVSCLLGLLIIAAIGQPLALILPLAIVWIAAAGVRIVRTCAGFRRVTALRLNDLGMISIVGPRDAAEQAHLMAGSKVLPAVAWFRIVTADGRELTELVGRASQADRDWRRLHILWRLGNSFIGATSRN